MRTTLYTLGSALVASAMFWGQEPTFGGRDVPESRRADAALTTQRCASCHSMNKVFRSDHVGAEWGPVVLRMQEKEKSGLSDGDVARVTEFLTWWSSPETPVAEKGAATKAPSPAAAPTLTGTLGARETAVLARGVLPSELPLPAAFELEDLTVHVVALAPLRAGDPHQEVSAQLRVGSREGRVSFRRDPSGVAHQEMLEIRNWRLGGRGYRQVVVIAPIPESSAGEVELALLVVSDGEPPSAKSRLREALSKATNKARKGKDKSGKREDDDDDDRRRESSGSDKSKNKPRKDDSCPVNH